MEELPTNFGDFDRGAVLPGREDDTSGGEELLSALAEVTSGHGRHPPDSSKQYGRLEKS